MIAAAEEKGIKTRVAHIEDTPPSGRRKKLIKEFTKYLHFYGGLTHATYL
jgi:hypothetical protein